MKWRGVKSESDLLQHRPLVRGAPLLVRVFKSCSDVKEERKNLFLVFFFAHIYQVSTGNGGTLPAPGGLAVGLGT